MYFSFNITYYHVVQRDRSPDIVIERASLISCGMHPSTILDTEHGKSVKNDIYELGTKKSFTYLREEGRSDPLDQYDES